MFALKKKKPALVKFTLTTFTYSLFFLSFFWGGETTTFTYWYYFLFEKDIHTTIWFNEK